MSRGVMHRSCALFLSLLPVVVAQLAIQTSTPPQISGISPLYLSYAPNGQSASYQIYMAAPPGSAPPLNATQVSNLNQTGNVAHVTTNDLLNANLGEIALISCDESAYQGSMFTSSGSFVSAIVGKITSSASNTGAVILYTLNGTWCSWNGSQSSAVFTLGDAGQANNLLQILNNTTTANQTGYISTQQSSLSPNAPSGSSYPGTPSTTIAMIVLYSVTGIITFLFLLVVLFGAMRVHRHPERYGPRNILGMPRQSRARGMARAMLETIPIVNWGEGDQQRGAKATGEAQSQDIELAGTSTTGSDPKQIEATDSADQASRTRDGASLGSLDPTNIAAAHAVPDKTSIEKEQDTETQSKAIEAADVEIPHNVPGASTVQIEPAARQSAEASAEDVASCPICTEDFVQGEPARLLPCNHHFHPTCIDPWLLNVSSTCPMCRIDLNPPSENDGEEIQHTQGSEGMSQEPAQWPYNRRNNGSQTQRRVFASGLGFLNLTHMSQANPEQRIRVLRQIRSARQDSDGTGDGQSRRARLARLFRRQSAAEDNQVIGEAVQAGGQDSAAIREQQIRGQQQQREGR